MTQCLRPLAPTDEELLRHVLDGEALSVAAREHLQQCHFCQQRLEEYTSTNNFALSRLYRSQCPDTTTLSHYCAGMLSINEAMSVVGHLDLCPLCTKEVAETRLWLATFEPFPEEHTSPPPIPDAILSAHSIPWQPRPVTRDQAQHEPEHLWPRQYQADTVCISLHLARDKQDAILLLGQLSHRNASQPIELVAGTKVELYGMHESRPSSAKESLANFNSADVPGPCISTHADELGHIVFRAVPPGRYLMIIYLPETEIVIEELNIYFH